MFKRITASAVLWMFFTGLLAGCNTMEGAGEDIEAGGEAIQNEAEEHND